MVRSRRLELPQDLSHSDLNAARLPIPPRPHFSFSFHLLKGSGKPEITNLFKCYKRIYTEMKMRTSTNTSNLIEWKSQKEWIPYSEAINWMEHRVKTLQDQKGCACIWLVEHPPLYTLGSRGREKDVFPSAKFPMFKSGRGGQVTYHGPGQRVVYVMLDLNTRVKDLKRYVFDLEEWIILALRHFDIQGERRKGRIGIWVQKEGKDHKIAAIGVRVQKWVTSHGFALNINPDLRAYKDIIPCGLSQYGITSLHDLGVLSSMTEVDTVLRQTCPF